MEFELGDRQGGYVLLRDSESGEAVAVRPGSVPAALASDGRTILLMPGGKLVVIDADIITVLRFLSP